MLKSYLITFFISMVPIVELRGAISPGLKEQTRMPFDP